MICEILARDCKCKKACKIDKYLDIKMFSYKKRLLDKSTLACGDEIWKTIEISLKHEK